MHLSLLERQCYHTYFLEPQTKGWLFDSLVTPSLMYVVVVWALGLPPFIWSIGDTIGHDAIMTNLKQLNYVT